MRRKVTFFFLILIIVMAEVFSVPTSSYGYDDLSFSALYNPSYFDRIEDAMINPSALSRVETDDQMYFTFIMSESWDTPIMRRKEDMYALQNLNTEMHFSFVGNTLSLTAITSTWFSDRMISESGLSFDIYNRIGIQIDWSGSFDFFSFGVRIKGGGDMRRRNRTVTGVINAIENAYFGSFDNVDGSEFFDIGASLALNFNVFSLSYFVENIISYRSNELYFGWQEILDSSSFGISLRYPQFTRRGDLNLFRPRIGYSIRGNIFDTATVTFNAGIEMQLLPTLSIHLATAYREYDHRAFNFNRENGVLMFALAAEGDSYAVQLMCNVDTASFSRVYPAIAFTLSR